MELAANHNITQITEVCSDFEKRNKLIKHLDQISSENAKVLIFVGTKRVADDITRYLRQDGWPALAIHGDKEQYVALFACKAMANIFFRRERDWVLGEFKAGRSPILIATDVASRGLGMSPFLSFFMRPEGTCLRIIQQRCLSGPSVILSGCVSKRRQRYLGRVFMRDEF